MAIKLFFQPLGRGFSSSIEPIIDDTLCAGRFTIEAWWRASATLEWESDGGDIEMTNVKVDGPLTLALRFLHAWHAAEIRTDRFVLGSPIGERECVGYGEAIILIEVA